MQQFGARGLMVYLVCVYSVMTGFALWRRALKPETIKCSAADVLRASPVTTPVAARAMVKEEERAGTAA